MILFFSIPLFRLTWEQNEPCSWHIVTLSYAIHGWHFNCEPLPRGRIVAKRTYSSYIIAPSACWGHRKHLWHASTLCRRRHSDIEWPEFSRWHLDPLHSYHSSIQCWCLHSLGWLREVYPTCICIMHNSYMKTAHIACKYIYNEPIKDLLVWLCDLLLAYWSRSNNTCMHKRITTWLMKHAATWWCLHGATFIAHSDLPDWEGWSPLLATTDCKDQTWLRYVGVSLF